MCPPSPLLLDSPLQLVFTSLPALLSHINTHLLPQTTQEINSSSREPSWHSQGVGREPSFQQGAERRGGDDGAMSVM